MPTTYEWDIEMIDGESGDVMDHFHETKLMNLEGLIGFKPAHRDAYYQLVLIRDRLDGNEEIAERKWSYVSATAIDEGFKVPAKYRKELAASINRIGKKRYERMDHHRLSSSYYSEVSCMWS